MDVSKLTVRRPDDPQPYWAVAHIVYDSGPVVAVLWWDDDPQSYAVVDELGVVGEMGSGDVEQSWAYWILDDQSPSPADPRRPAANVFVIDGNESPARAMELVAEKLERKPTPSGTFEESLDRIEQSLWRFRDGGE